jgi:hypothetical protein
MKKSIFLMLALVLFGCSQEHKNASADKQSAASASSMATASNGGAADSAGAGDQATVTKIEWEPIGKYSDQEIATASAFIGDMWKHLIIMDGIDKDYEKRLRAAAQGSNKNAALSMIKTYDAQTLVMYNEVSAMKLPDLKNPQARKSISEALEALKKGAAIKHQSAELTYQTVHGDVSSDEAIPQIKELSDRWNATIVPGMTKLEVAYLSYGYTFDAVDKDTMRLKTNYKPDRDKDAAKN